MSYLVLARKYRPQSFEDLAGQGHVATTLANAIAQGRVAHAFLFTGVRGVGKTTSARLLAKCLNCLGADGKATGPTSTPCQTCAACTEIANGSDMDVQEIDGASYNGVDEVRRLQEGIVFRPARDRFKIYIVDEVHMLSNAAWNAFLKTLEEPPPHVKFIFATTEVHKVPVTILSRCQRYDFKLIGTRTIADRLREVLGKEEITADDASLSILAHEAQGSMRDAMSLLDQVIAYSGKTLTEADVTKVLGVASRSALHELSLAVIEGDAGRALELVNGLAEQGFDLVHLARDWTRQLRNLVVVKVSDPSKDLGSLLDVSDAERQELAALAKKTEADDILRVYQGFSKTFDEIAKSPEVKIALEMTLVRLARRPPLLPLDELLSRLGDLEKRIAGGAPPPGTTPSRGGSGATSGGGPATRPFAREAAPPPARPLPEFVGGTPAASPPTTSPPTTQATATVTSILRHQVKGSLAIAPFQAPVLPDRPDAPPDSREPSLALVRDPEPVPAIPLDPPPPAVEEALRSLAAVVRSKNQALAAAIEDASPIAISSEALILAFDASRGFSADLALEPKNLAELAEIAKAHLGARVEVRVDTKVDPKGLLASLASLDADRARKRIEAAKKAVADHPLVAHALRVFEADLARIVLPDGA